MFYVEKQCTQLAFVCLLAVVGIPMIFVGKGFCERMDGYDVKNSGEVHFSMRLLFILSSTSLHWISFG